MEIINVVQKINHHSGSQPFVTIAAYLVKFWKMLMINFFKIIHTVIWEFHMKIEFIKVFKKIHNFLK